MIVVTTDTIYGKSIQPISMVTGSTVQSKNFVKDFGAGMKSIVGGELVSYTKMLTEARNIAIERMVAAAQQMGADAIVNVRFSSAAILQGAAEILVSGTAVKIIG